MPKQTFENLPQEKRDKLFDAAVVEFARVRFSEASINQVVKGAGIARGSFYQYFHSKQDLFAYVLARIAQEKMDMVTHLPPPGPDADFEEAMAYMMHSAIAWAREQPLYNRVGMLMMYDESDFIKQLLQTAFAPPREPADGLQAAARTGMAHLRGLVERDKALGRIRPDVDSQLVVDVLTSLMAAPGTMDQYYKDGSEETALSRLHAICKLIKEGIAHAER